MKIAKKDLESIIETFIFDGLSESEYGIFEIKAHNLLTWNRLDIAFKLFYLDYIESNAELALEVYSEDIRCQTTGSYKEFGNNNKNSLYEFSASFQKIYNNIKNNGFNEKLSLIPISNAGTIINGAHRVASAIHLNQPLICVKLDSPAMTCDYNFYLKRNVPLSIIETSIIKFLEYSENSFIAFLWPSGIKNEKKALSNFKKVVYKKRVSLSYNGTYNLLVELYKHMDWVGSIKNNYQGIQKKLFECFPTNESLTIVVFQSESIEKVRELKNNIRDLNRIGYSSIHITDTKEEAIRISNLLLNSNALHFLNFAKPFKFKNEYSKIAKIKTFINNNNLDKKDILIDSSFILSIYGLRKSNDIDYLISDKVKIIKSDNAIERHDSELAYHGLKKHELLYNPKYYFIYEEIKFISFSQLYVMKKNRNENKDVIDCKLMEALIANHRLKKNINQLIQYFFYIKIKVTYIIMNPVMQFLRWLGIYYLVRRYYRKLRGIR